LVYNAAGLDASLNFLNTLFVYDPGTDSWTQLASMSAQRERPAVAAIDGLLYVTNGWDPGGSPTGALEIYDPSTDTWSTGAPNPAPMGGGSDGLNFEGKFYVIGGCDSGSCGHTNVQVYDPSSDSWSSAADYPESISWQACGSIGGLIYCAGGTAGSGTTANAYVYDPGTDSWSPIAPMPQDQWAMGYIASDDKLYVSGGVTDGFSTITNEGFSYDPSTDTWTAIENSNNTLYRGAGACGFTKIGGSSGGFSPVPNSEVYPGLTNCGGAADVPWLSENPTEGTIPADGGQVVIDVNYDAAQVLQPGDFFAHINVKGNSPGQTPKVDVTMHVPVPPNFGLLEGTVTGLGQCDTAGGPINKATVFIDGPNADYTLETDASGHYQWYFDAANSPVDVTVSATGYIGMTQTGVVMTPGQTTTVDFSLRLDAPCLTVDPTSLDQTLPLGGQATQQITINNTGAGDANYKIHESGGADFKQPNLPKAISRADKKRLAMSGPTSVRTLKNARPEKLKGIFPINVPNAWIPGASNPNPVIRYGHAQCDETPESFYVISGVDSGFGLSNAVSRYDADTDSWTSLAPIPSASEAPTSVCFEGKIYVAVGAGTSNEFMVYDVASDSWSSAATLPRFVEGAAMGALDGKIYLIGGDDDFQPASGVSNEVNIYDIATNTWTGNGASEPTATAQSGYVQSGTFVYVVGGWGVSAPGSNSNQTQRYDMSSDTWEVGPTFDVAVSDFAIAGTDTALYAMGGDQNGGGFFEPTNTAQRLDLSSWPGGAWADLGDPLPTARQANQAGFCTTAFTGGEVWTTDAFDGGSVSGINDYRNTGEGCAGAGGDVPWLSENPSEGVVPAGGNVVVDVTFDASQVPAEGDYFAQLKVSGNAPGASPTVDVALHVSGGACTYSNNFNDGVLEWIEERPAVTEPGDGFLHLTPVRRKAVGVADSSFAGASTGTFTFDIQFSGGPTTKNWIYTHRVDRRHQIEILFKEEQDKIVLKQRNTIIVKKQKADFTLMENVPYQVQIVYNGSTYDLSINGTPVITGFSASALPSGNIGAAAKGDTLLIDNVCVQ
jgi:N-acetylneuraminic acid mutarotase